MAFARGLGFGMGRSFGWLLGIAMFYLVILAFMTERGREILQASSAR